MVLPDAQKVVQRHGVLIQKYVGDSTEGEPAETLEVVKWFDPAGEITDPERIAELEAQRTQEEADCE